MVATTDALRALVEPALVSAGVELWDVEMSHDAVRVLVDRPGGVDLEALADLAGKVVSPLLDQHPEMTPATPFSLEVSSPGVERPLRRVEHFARYVGEEVSVKTSVPIAGARRHQGTLSAVDTEGIVVTPNDADGSTVEVPFRDIERARAVLVWGPAPKPGGKAPKPGASKSGKSNTQAVKRPAASGSTAAAQPVASREKDTER
jgi:ribosome maturation factor RimP